VPNGPLTSRLQRIEPDSPILVSAKPTGTLVLRDLNAESVWVVHGNGLDEITTTGTTQVAALENGSLEVIALDSGQRVRSIGGLTPDANRKLSARLCEVVGSAAHVPADRPDLLR